MKAKQSRAFSLTVKNDPDTNNNLYFTVFLSITKRFKINVNHRLEKYDTIEIRNNIT